MKKFQPTWSRRKFLSAITITGAGTAMLLNPLAAWAIHEVDPRVAGIVANTLGIDTHIILMYPLSRPKYPVLISIWPVR
jgi:membrane dipeptidase